MSIRVMLLAVSLIVTSASGEDRFGRPILKVSDTKQYEFLKQDGIKYPTLSNERFSVSCLAYRGTEHYYVEVNVTNKTNQMVPLQPSFISFEKPGYTVDQADTMMIARQAAGARNASFVPTRPSYVPPTYKTTVNATAITYGDQTSISGNETTTPDYSGQAGANLGNAVGNAIAAHRFYKAQRNAMDLSRFLAEHAQIDSDTALPAGKSRVLVAAFDQLKRKKKPFNITIRLGSDVFTFRYKE